MITVVFWPRQVCSRVCSLVPDGSGSGSHFPARIWYFRRGSYVSGTDLIFPAGDLIFPAGISFLDSFPSIISETWHDLIESGLLGGILVGGASNVTVRASVVGVRREGETPRCWMLSGVSVSKSVGVEATSVREHISVRASVGGCTSQWDHWRVKKGWSIVRWSLK